MATLQKIRNQAGLLVIVIGLAMLAFIIGDFLTSGSTFFNMNRDKVAVVNGKRITVEEFQMRVNRAVEEEQMRYRTQYNRSMPEERSSQINKEIFDRMVSEMVLSDATKEMGLGVSAEELQDLLTGDNLSMQVIQLFGDPRTGEVDQARIKEFIQYIFSDDQSQYTPEELERINEQRNFWIELEKSVKEERLMTKLFTAIQKSLQPNDLDLEASFNESLNMVDFVYASQMYTAIPDSTVTVTDKEMQAMYDKKKETFKRDASRQIKYISVNIVPSEADYKITEEKINNFKKQFAETSDVSGLLSFNTDVPYVDVYTSVKNMSGVMKDFVSKATKDEVFGPFFENDSYKMYRLMGRTTSPDSVKVRHIMLRADQETLRDSLMTEIKKGADFKAMASQYSIDTNSSSNGGEMGWLTEPMAVTLGKDFIEKCFRGNEKGAFKVETNYGIHIVQVEERTKPVEKAKVAQFVLNVRPSSETYGNLYNQVSQYIAENNTLENFEKGDTEKGITVQTAMLHPDDININNVRDARQAVKWAFNADKGDLSEIFNVDNKFLVAMVYEENEDGYAPIADVESQLRYTILSEKKGDMIAEALAGTEGGIEAYASKMSSKIDTVRGASFMNPVITGIGFEPKIAGIAPYTQAGTVTAPVKGTRGVYVIDVINKIPVSSNFDKPTEVLRYNQIIRQALYGGLLDVLESKADIEDNRIKFF